MTEDKSSELGQRIRKFREEAGMTLTELAEKAGVTKGYISQIESGGIKKVAASHLFDIAEALGTSIGYLLGRQVVFQSKADMETPPELREFQQKYDVPPEDVRMLESIEFRGERPKSVDGWKFIYEAIKHGRNL